MNEKELNMESSINEQPVFNDEPLGQPVNLMEDFTQAVASETVDTSSTVLVSEDGSNQESIQTLDSVPLSSSTQSSSVVEENIAQPEVGVTVPASPATGNNEFGTVDPQSEAITEVGQVSLEQTEITQRKKNNWVFIILLFAVVGAFVIALPFLVKAFGY